MNPRKVWCGKLGTRRGINGQWRTATEKSDYVTMIMATATVAIPEGRSYCTTENTIGRE